MEFKELTLDELELLEEEERTQYEKELDLFKKRTAFVAQMEKLGGLKIEQLEKRELKPIPVIKNPEVPAFESPELSIAAVGTVEVPAFSVKQYESCDISVPEIKKVSTAGYGKEIRKMEKLQPELKEYPKFEKTEEFTDKFVMPEAAGIADVRVQSPEIAIPGKIEAAPKVSEMKCKVPVVEVPEHISCEAKAPAAEIRVPNVAVPEGITCEVKVPVAEIQVPKVAIPENITCEVKTPTAEIRVPNVAISKDITCEVRVSVAEIHVPQVAIPENITCEVKTPAADIKVPNVAVPEGITCEVKAPAAEIRVPNVAVPEIITCEVKAPAAEVRVPDCKVPKFSTVKQRSVKSSTVRIPKRKEKSFHGVEAKEPQPQKVFVPGIKTSDWEGLETDVNIQNVKISCPKTTVPQYTAAERKGFSAEKLSVKVQAPNLEKLGFELKSITRSDRGNEEKTRQFIAKAESLRNIVIPKRWEDIVFGTEQVNEKQ